jgi:3-oxoacyl-(acyl-carrier-protein) synthase
MLAGGAAERAVVVSSEELNELSLSSYTRLGYSFLSEGAGAVMIEQEETVKGTSPYCAIAGMASECNPSGADAALENSIMRCLDIADLLTSDIDLVMADEKVAVNQFMRSVPAGSIIPLAGNAFAVSVIWDILLSAMALKNGAMPHTIIRNGAAVPVRLNNVMICTADLKGSAAAIILSKCI